VRIHAELADADVHVGRKRIARLMRQAGIGGCHRRKHQLGTTKQNPNAAAAPDPVDRQFTATAPNQLWVADPCANGAGLALPGVCHRRVPRMILGWSMASHRKTDLVVDAVTMAMHRRGGKVPGVIHAATAEVSTPLTSSSANCVATALWPPWAAWRTAC